MGNLDLGCQGRLPGGSIFQDCTLKISVFPERLKEGCILHPEALMEAGPDQRSPQGRLAGTCWVRTSAGTTHPWEPCCALGAAVREWVLPEWHEHAARPGTISPFHLYHQSHCPPFIKGNSAGWGGGAGMVVLLPLW